MAEVVDLLVALVLVGASMIGFALIGKRVGPFKPALLTVGVLLLAAALVLVLYRAWGSSL